MVVVTGGHRDVPQEGKNAQKSKAISCKGKRQGNPKSKERKIRESSSTTAQFGGRREFMGQMSMGQQDREPLRANLPRGSLRGRVLQVLRFL